MRNRNTLHRRSVVGHGHRSDLKKANVKFRGRDEVGQMDLKMICIEFFYMSVGWRAEADERLPALLRHWALDNECEIRDRPLPCVSSGENEVHKTQSCGGVIIVTVWIIRNSRSIYSTKKGLVRAKTREYTRKI